MVNSAPTALTFEIADLATSGSNMINEITVTGGDWVSIQCDPDNTPDIGVYATWSSIFEGDTPNESLMLGGSRNSISFDTIKYNRVMGTARVWDANENIRRGVVPTAGTIKDLYLKLPPYAGGDGDEFRFTVRKGTPPGAMADTTLTVTITSPATTGSDLVNSFTVAAGDIVTLRCEPLNPPLDFWKAIWGMTFVADIDGESIVMGGDLARSLDDTATEWNDIQGPGTWGSPEDEWELGQACILKKLYMFLSGAPGAGTSYTFSLSIVADSNNVVAIVADAATTGNSGALTDTMALDDWITIKVIPAGTPATPGADWGFVSFIEPPVGWTGKISGVTDPAEIMGVAKADIAAVMGVA